MAYCKLNSVLCADADPILAYSAGAEVNQLQWSTTQPDWVAICFANKTQVRPQAGALVGPVFVSVTAFASRCAAICRAVD